MKPVLHRLLTILWTLEGAFAAGVVTLATGCGWIYPPAGLIVAGAAVILVCWLYARADAPDVQRLEEQAHRLRLELANERDDHGLGE